MLRKAVVGAGAGLGMVAGVWFGNAVAENFKLRADAASGCASCSNKAHERFNKLAATYDAKIGPTEDSFGMQEMRKRLVSKHAVGSVLETCCGTGRNTAFYDANKVTSLVLTDASEEMLTEAKTKKTAIPSVAFQATKTLDHFPAESFDTVVDTFGICSVNKPEEFLLQVHRVLKPGGRAVFLEHGRSEEGWFSFIINAWLDFRAPSHEAYWGCLWNREISKLVNEAGFKVIHKQVHHYGTCTEIQATK